MLIKPFKDENREKFINRFMEDPRMVQDYPDDIQRMAVCLGQWDSRDKKSWYDIVDKGDDKPVDIYIYDEIGLWGIGTKEFLESFKYLKGKNINIHIHSPGGSVFDGTAIYNIIKNHEGEVNTYIDGVAASIASIIALAGKTVNMAENGWFMIHNPSGIALGDSEEMRKMAELLDKVTDIFINTYQAKCKKSKKQIRQFMDEETWFTSKSALEAGFVDNITGKIEANACLKFAANMKHLGFKKIPESPMTQNGVTAKKTGSIIGKTDLIKQEDELISKMRRF